jgi:hypothetical protein
MTYDLRAWPHLPTDRQPLDLPHAMEELSQRQKDTPTTDERVRLQGFAHALSAAAPNDAWIGDLVASASTLGRAVFSFSFGNADPAVLLATATDAAFAHCLCLLDEQMGLLWRTDGTVIGAHGNEDDEWAASCMKFHAGTALPKTEAAVRKYVRARLEARILPLGFRRLDDQVSVTGVKWLNWENVQGAGRITIMLKTGVDHAGRVHCGTDWDLWLKVHNEQCSAAVTQLHGAQEGSRPTCELTLRSVQGAAWRRICSPDSLADVDRALDAILVPLLQRLDGLRALDAFVNEPLRGPMRPG